MRSLTGYLRKILSRSKPGKLFSFIFIVLATQIVLTPILQIRGKIYAQNENSTSFEAVSTLSISRTGELGANMKINISSSSPSPTVIKYYNLVLPYTKLSKFSARIDGKTLQYNSSVEGKYSKVIIDLDNVIISGNRSVELNISFQIPKYLDLEKELKKVLFPLELPGVTVSKSTIQIPNSVGDLKYVLGANADFSKDSEYTTVIVGEARNPTITLIFGDTPAYNFTISKSLNNPDSVSKVAELILPLTNHQQSLFITTINPSPDYAFKDEDSNIAMSYSLDPGERVNVVVKGKILLNDQYAENDRLQYPTSEKYIKAEGFWALTDEVEMKRFDFYLKQNGITFETIPGSIAQLTSLEEREKFYATTHRYIIDRLNLSDDNDSKTSSRSGATGSIKNSQYATSDDYADLMIALLRNYQVPSRMIVGYITDISGAFDSGFYHSWVELWDPEAGWYSADPALEETLGNSMFNKQFIDHIALISRGTNPLKPKLPFYSTDDISFDYTEELLSESNELQLDSTLAEIQIPYTTVGGTMLVQNRGNTVLTGLSVDSQDKLTMSELPEQTVIVPGQQYEVKISAAFPPNELIKDVENPKASMQLTATSIYGSKVTVQTSAQPERVKLWWWEVYIRSLSTLALLGMLYVTHKIFRMVYPKQWKST